MKREFIKMDGNAFEIAEWDYINSTVVLWEVNSFRTVNIPMFFLTNPGFQDAMRIEYISDPTLTATTTEETLL